MAYVGFLSIGKGSYQPLGVTTSGGLLGAVFGFVLASTFAARTQRRKKMEIGKVSK
jgi:hypothetical protein